MKRIGAVIFSGLTLLLLISLAITVPVEIAARKHSKITKIEFDGSDRSFRYHVIGDYGELDGGQTMDVEKVASSMSNRSNDHPIDFIATVGDNVYPDGMVDVLDITQSELLYSIFRQPGLAGKPWYPALGNHDCKNTPPMLEANDIYPMWNMPSSYYNLTVSLSNYTYAALIFLNGCTIACEVVDNIHLSGSCAHNIPEAEIDSQYAWLQQVLTDSQDADWILVHIHMPPFSAGSNHGDNEALKLRLYPLLAEFRVDFLFVGHDHIMQYIFVPSDAVYAPLPDLNYTCEKFADVPYISPLVDSFVQMRKGEGLHEIGMGASGHSLNELCIEKVSTMDRLLFGMTTYGFTEVDVAPGSVTVNFIAIGESEPVFTLQVIA